MEGLENAVSLVASFKATHQPLGRIGMQNAMQNTLDLCGSAYKLLCVDVWWWGVVLPLTANRRLRKAGQENVLAWEVERPKRLQNGLFVFIVYLFTLLLVASSSFTQKPQSTVLPGPLRVSHG